jgi:hypothetical protein
VATDDAAPKPPAPDAAADDPTAGDAAAAPLLDAIGPVAEALGGRVVDVTEVVDGDIPLTWRGTVVGGLRVPRSLADLRHALADSIAAVERELGGALRSLSREDKQRAVRLLDERGVFVLRKSIEDVADAMGVSRMTIYTYLDAIHRD